MTSCAKAGGTGQDPRQLEQACGVWLSTFQPLTRAVSPLGNRGCQMTPPTPLLKTEIDCGLVGVCELVSALYRGESLTSPHNPCSCWTSLGISSQRFLRGSPHLWSICTCRITRLVLFLPTPLTPLPTSRGSFSGRKSPPPCSHPDNMYNSRWTAETWGNSWQLECGCGAWLSTLQDPTSPCHISPEGEHSLPGCNGLLVGIRNIKDRYRVLLMLMRSRRKPREHLTRNPQL